MANVTGVCGRDCSGIAGVDTIGVYEIDSKTNKVVATHALAEGIGGDPYPSPDGSESYLQSNDAHKKFDLSSDTILSMKIRFTRNYRVHCLDG